MLFLPVPPQSPTVLTLDFAKPGVQVSPVLYGHMTEEINFSYDGGLYAELVRNRAFKDNAEKPVSWSALGQGTSMTLDRRNPAAPALHVSLQVQGKDESAGVSNEGYWGFPVRPQTQYSLSFWAKASQPGPMSASLESRDGKTVYARSAVAGVASDWKKLSAVLTTEPGITPTKDARFVLRTGNRTVWLSLVSLFPPTYANRENGLRPDLMELLLAMKPKFLRFPGGNYLEGNTFKDRFPWKETLGPLEERPGHQGTWGYRSSDGMGLLEFLLWCKDMNAKPVLGVFAGYVLNRDYVKAGTELEGFVKDALDQIEYIIGDPKKTKWGARRAKDGHPEPFELEYVEVGNEDGFDDSGSYEDRFVQFYDAIKKKYPRIKVISSTGGTDGLGAKFPIRKRRPDLWDEHYYLEAWDMMASATKYDSYDRKGPKVFVGEWAAHDTLAPWQAGPNAGPTPNMKCTLGDAAFMTGMERNSDIVEMSCYAPLLVNVNPGGRQWSLNLIGYDALSSFGSPSYYAQKMFAENLGDRTVNIKLDNVPTQKRGEQTLPGIFASATKDSKSGQVFIKLVNALPTEQEVRFELNGAKVDPLGVLTTLSGELKAMNSIEAPTLISPKVLNVDGLGNQFSQKLPGYSVVVLKLQSR